ncbi:MULTISPECIES: sigma-70 family RNA polymerase sigma factor [unclassified Pseudoalteromonas]|uniref:sigma-70 family RNA polymerase sigma factor n=1 Tax=unclassified Pseudoalteromonas TaxID=194690 RepID=UPI002097852B|nr:sigma-70 family RNA polymerase sigma factor [Pseudoalteromonas sp. XMcav2-N]MCO7188096.1 sigma-70 family RNA polymerase sigma factor [Pseudoalteromonas sp. XMcav2-N]
MSSNTSNSLDSLYQEHYAWLVKWISRRTQNWGDAQDVAQDTFVKLLGRPDKLENVKSTKAWLAKIADNLVIDKVRREILEKNYLTMLANMPEAHTPSAEQKWETLELLEQVDRLLNGLKPKEKLAFLLVRLEGMAYKDVAAQLEVSLSSAEKYVAKAMMACYVNMYGLE